MGQMLAQTERADGGDAMKKKARSQDVTELPPTLAEIGVTKRESAEAQMLAQTERAKGTDKGGRQYVDGNMPLPSNPPPTLAGDRHDQEGKRGGSDAGADGEGQGRASQKNR